MRGLGVLMGVSLDFKMCGRLSWLMYWVCYMEISGIGGVCPGQSLKLIVMRFIFCSNNSLTSPLEMIRSTSRPDLFLFCERSSEVSRKSLKCRLWKKKRDGETHVNKRFRIQYQWIGTLMFWRLEKGFDTKNRPLEIEKRKSRRDMCFYIELSFTCSKVNWPHQLL